MAYSKHWINICSIKSIKSIRSIEFNKPKPLNQQIVVMVVKGVGVVREKAESKITGQITSYIEETEVLNE